MLNLGSQPKTVAAADFIKDTDTMRFEQDVLNTSMKTPVIVDFWAPWCGPCRQMMPVLEKVVAAANGAVHLVKINVDQNPELAQGMRVQSVPMVYAFFQGQPVDGFMGARPEQDIKAFVDKLQKLAGGVDQKVGAVNAEAIAKEMAKADKLFQDGSYTEAMAAYSMVLDAAPEETAALAGIGWCFVAQKDPESLKEMLSQLNDEQTTHPRMRGLIFLTEKSQEAEGHAYHQSLEDRLKKNPKEHAARYALALFKLSILDIEGSIDELITLTKYDRAWEDQKARKFLLEMFEALGPAHPLASYGRRQLSSILFS